MLVTSSSPAPRAAASAAHATASRPVGSRPPLRKTSQPLPSPRRLASMATTMHCAPKRAEARSIRPGSRTAAELSDTLSAPAASTARMSSSERSPPPIVNGMKTSSAVRRARLNDRPALLVARGDVEEDELVGALGVVARGELDGVARVAQADEVDPLHHPALVDVEAGDDADHPAPSSTRSASPIVKRPS